MDQKLPKMHHFSKSAIFLTFSIVVFALVAALSIFLLFGEKTSPDRETSSGNESSNQAEISKNDNEPPLKIKSLGINLDLYDQNTGKAGDLKFTKAAISLGLLFTDFGFVIPATSASGGQEKANPQPTFIAPLGTKVMSLVDGVVVDIPKLYSGDYSVMVATDKNSSWIYETEHVINPIVKIGDTVKAGQVVAEVSDYDAKNYDGLGLFEIGILKGGNPPSHVCPFAYLDDSIKEEVQNKLKALYKSWEEYRGDSSLYDESKHVVPGCYTLDPIVG